MKDLDKLREAAEEIEGLGSDADWLDVDRKWRVYQRASRPKAILPLLDRLEAAEAKVDIAEKRPELHRCFRRLAAAEKLIEGLIELVKDVSDPGAECEFEWDHAPPCQCRWCNGARDSLALYDAYRKEHTEVLKNHIEPLETALREIAYEPLTDNMEATHSDCLDEAVRIAREALAIYTTYRKEYGDE